MEERFSTDNRFRRVSLDQFKRIAERLESSLIQIRPTIQSELLLTTNEGDYYGYGSLTILTPEVKETLARRERYKLADLNEKLWEKSLKIQLRIADNSVEEAYCIWLSAEEREPKRLFFYGQCLDESSQKVLHSFRKENLFQRIGDGFKKPSDFAVSYALANLYH